MKKLLFASACVAAVAAFGAGSIFNSTGFEDIGANTTEIHLLTDDGKLPGEGGVTSGFYWWYQDKESSKDGSTVKAFGSDDNLPRFDYSAECSVPSAFTTDDSNTKYLELSTEGGTLWRTAVDRGQTPSIGNGVAMGALGTIDKVYVDTMVQFTPTEDDEPPAVEAADKLAIWLNVATTDETTGETETNLCVLARSADGATSQIHTITNFVVNPGVWYRLTVKYIKDITNNDMLPGFMIWLDGTLLESDKQALPEDQLTALLDYEYIEASYATKVRKGSVFASLEGTIEGNDDGPTFYAVGFKGSGAIDDLQIGDEDPNFLEAVGSFDFTLTWDENVSAVSYTIGGTTTDINLTEGSITVSVEAGETVTVAATAKDWYQITAGLGEVTVNEAKTVEITASLADTPSEAGAGTGLGDDVTTEEAKKWADAKHLTPDAISKCTYAKKAYLMNTDLSGEPGLQITSITEVEGGWQITVKGTQGENAVTLKGINGQLYVKAAATIKGLAEAAPATYDFAVGENGEATITVTGDAKNFMKVTVGVKATPVITE